MLHETGTGHGASGFTKRVGSSAAGQAVLALLLLLPLTSRAANSDDNVTFQSTSTSVAGSSTPANPGMFLNQSWNVSGGTNGTTEFNLDYAGIIDVDWFFGADLSGRTNGQIEMG